MKHSWNILLIGLLAGTVHADLQLNSNLLANAGFETGDGWDGTVYQTTEKVHEGDYALFGGATANNTIRQTIVLTDISGFSDAV